VTFSWATRPLKSSLWRPRDDIQASGACLWFIVFCAHLTVSTPLFALPDDPLLAAYIVLLAIPLALDPLAALAFTSGLGTEDQP
jgi:hypothetical protein